MDSVALVGLWLGGLLVGFGLRGLLQDRRRRIHGEDEFREIYREWTNLEHMDSPFAEAVLDIADDQFWGEETIIWTARFKWTRWGYVIVVDVDLVEAADEYLRGVET